VSRIKFADLSEYGYGVAILSESKYGFSCQGNVLRISLLRAATAPDAEQDQGGVLIAHLLSLAKIIVFYRQARVFVGCSATPRPLLGVERPHRSLPL
jgi:hypothetical protein